MSRRLENKVAIVTGGSRGIGLATVKAFLREGAKVILAASSQESADKAVAKLREEFPESTIGGIAPDLLSLASMQEAFGKVAEEYGRIDILVNNAGMASYSSIFTMDVGEFTKIIDLNVNAVFN